MASLPKQPCYPSHYDARAGAPAPTFFLTPKAEQVIEDYIRFVGTKISPLWQSLQNNFKQSRDSFGRQERNRFGDDSYSWYSPFHYWYPTVIDNSTHIHQAGPAPLPPSQNGNSENSAAKIAIAIAIIVGLVAATAILIKCVVHYISWGNQRERALDVCNTTAWLGGNVAMTPATRDLVSNLNELTTLCRPLEEYQQSRYKKIAIASTALIIVGLTLTLFGVFCAINPLLVAGCVVTGISFIAVLSNWKFSPKPPEQQEDLIDQINKQLKKTDTALTTWKDSARPNVNFARLLDPSKLNLNDPSQRRPQLYPASDSRPEELALDQYYIQSMPTDDNGGVEYRPLAYNPHAEAPQPSAPPMDSASMPPPPAYCAQGAQDAAPALPHELPLALPTEIRLHRADGSIEIINAPELISRSPYTGNVEVEMKLGSNFSAYVTAAWDPSTQRWEAYAIAPPQQQ